MWIPIKIILKGEKGLVTQSDNTKVAKPIIQEKVPYKLKPNEFYFIDMVIVLVQMNNQSLYGGNSIILIKVL